VAVPFSTTSNAAAIVTAFRELPVSGWHIHGGDLQKDAVQVMDELDGTATQQAKVNAIVRQADGGLTGHWVESPRQQFELWRGAA
jgi:shikimate 5-dehydrogenase